MVRLLIFLLLVTPLLAQAQQDDAARLDEARQTLFVIVQSLDEKRAEREELNRQLQSIRIEAEKEEMQADIEALNETIFGLENSFLTIASGGLDFSAFEDTQVDDYDWREDLAEIVKPLLDAAKNATEAPRNMERLRSNLTLEESRLKITENALAEIERMRTGDLLPELDEALAEIQESWEEKRDDTNRQLDIINYQLEERERNRDSMLTRLPRSIAVFLQGRGLNLLLALLVFAGVFTGLQYSMGWFLQRTGFQESSGHRVYFRLFNYGYRLATFLAALFAMLSVLYFAGDWILLGIFILALAATLLGLRTWIPRFLNETRMLLNLGPVREGERVTYKGVPWLVKAINVQSKLVNPRLQGGEVRLSLPRLGELQSRAFDPEESWFPTEQGDFVVLEDESFGEVLTQSPDSVRIKRVGGAITAMSTGAFLDCAPTNLSKGRFGVAVIFGIDYQHQEIVTTEAVDLFERFVSEGMEKRWPGMALVKASFASAAASSLDFRIEASMDSQTASEYPAMSRHIQALCVDLCNQKGWTIPFTQLTVHQVNDG